MHYLKFKWDTKEGICNICKKKGALTWDHVPPKGGIELTTVEIRNIYQMMTKESEEGKFVESQNGVKFRTICKSCNELMGGKYDPYINEFAISIGRYLKSTLHLPSIIHHKTRPTALIRGILGHLLSAKMESDEVNFDKDMPPIVLDQNYPIPDTLHVYYWVYPYNISINLRDVATSQFGEGAKSVAAFNMVKYFPIAYLVTNRSEFEGLEDLTRYKGININEEIEIPIWFNDIKHQFWPERKDDFTVLFGNNSLNSSTYAVQKQNRQT
jgi:hypothetical protein